MAVTETGASHLGLIKSPEFGPCQNTHCLGVPKGANGGLKRSA